ncbi:GNAT family N-acetyltransferase [Arthrobacter glacialis]|uniref:GNAT family N-acetyltransferase n=1 Tax=Arthrobacter glacialis TaxID=1664 RepID=UPI001FAEC245|nr:GNAT family N-acetyltransferase [Arthrobacter glacialis]
MDALEVLMNEAWPAPEAMDRDGWVLRSASSVTQRANSVWPRQAPADLAVALRDTVSWYATRRQPVIFQVTHRPENRALEQLLDLQRYSRQSETLIMTAVGSVNGAPATPAGITLTLSGAPSKEWIELWWRIDGRGAAAEREVARGILTGIPSLYASAVNGDGMVVGTGRVTLLNGWAGIYCMSVHPGFRRQGIAASILRQLLDAAHERGTAQAWLLVTAANAGAHALYKQGGFREVGRYHYRQAPLRRAPMAC